MDELFDRWASQAPKYDKIYVPLFEKLAKKFGGTEEGKENAGKIFNSNYELYIYAFFLGLYGNSRIPIEGERIDFRHEIKHWGKKGKLYDRKDYTILQRYIFMALVAKTDLDFIELDNAKENEIKKAAQQLREEFAEYTNAGLLMLQEQYETDKIVFNEKRWFLKKVQQVSEDVEDRKMILSV